MEDKKLIKVAKELNVGIGTVVEHLVKKGFDIENKPNAKITDPMYAELLREFQKDIAIKEQAEQLKNRPLLTKKETESSAIKTTPTISLLKKDEPVSLRKQETPPPSAEPEATPAIKPEAPQQIITPINTPTESTNPVADNRPKPRVVGKIDLDSINKPKVSPQAKEQKKGDKEQKTEQPNKAEKSAAPPKQKIEPHQKTPPPVIEKIEEPVIQEEADVFRAETPQLRGLKIQGKIDINKNTGKDKENNKDRDRDRRGRPDNDNRARNVPKPAGASTEQDSDDAAKRKRKRKKVTTAIVDKNFTIGGALNKPRTTKPTVNRRPDQKEVSQREIDDQIRQTMAKIASGGKNKRQKIRKDSRDRKHERLEALEQQNSDGKVLQVTEFVSVSELASLMNVPVASVITACMSLGVIVSINQRLDAEVIELIVNEFGYDVAFISAEEQVDTEEEIVDAPEDLRERAPIVTVMGHVDHGKTSLLDYIRKANVAGGEAGGITQHIGAYEVVTSEGKKVTFLDTPGHEAFTAMRARGAKITDVAVIIIAADDNVMPQTKEAISHAQAAGVPIIFAINKIDKAGAAPERIKQELASMNLLVEEWGGKYQSQDISAKQGLNVDKLLEKILLEAEVLDLKANPKRAALGTVIEASLDKGRGYVCKLLVQNGSLHIGDATVAGEYSGKVKAMFNERGKKITVAGPSTPVLVLGLGGAPQAGEKFKVVDSDQEARQIASKRAQIIREQATRAAKRISLDEIGRRLALGTFKELNLIVKGDVDGSIEALADSLIKLSIEKVQVNVIHKAVGQIIESDVLLASASDAIIIGFQVRPSVGARKLAEREGVEINTYSIIYEAIEEVKLAIEGMLEPTKEEKILGQIDVREVFKISKVGTVAGCFVTDGKVMRNNHIRVIREGIVIFPTKEGAAGEISSLKRLKDDAKEVKAGMDCGLTIKNFNDIKVGDNIEVYEITEVKQTYSK
ncbi:MAG: translation initiation factor IF-2 [Saprospiraceae bacterium]|nr:translation initiation factor IF-2 [Saprospiraceae bacterium]MBP7680015.1 translation initiation factor IF-2 [Saprospiraceae bacterium]